MFFYKGDKLDIGPRKRSLYPFACVSVINLLGFQKLLEDTDLGTNSVGSLEKVTKFFNSALSRIINSVVESFGGDILEV